MVGVGEVGADDEDKEVEDYVGRAEGEDNGLVDGPEDEKQNFEDVEVEFHIEEGKFSVQVVGKGSCIRRAVEWYQVDNQEVEGESEGGQSHHVRCSILEGVDAGLDEGTKHEGLADYSEVGGQGGEGVEVDVGVCYVLLGFGGEYLDHYEEGVDDGEDSSEDDREIGADVYAGVGPEGHLPDVGSLIGHSPGQLNKGDDGADLHKDGADLAVKGKSDKGVDKFIFEGHHFL